MLIVLYINKMNNQVINKNIAEDIIISSKRRFIVVDDK